MKDRHLDQLLLCAFYIMAKVMYKLGEALCRSYLYLKPEVKICCTWLLVCLKCYKPTVVNSSYYIYFYRLFITFFFFYFINLFILFIYYFWLCWVFVAVCGLSLVAESGGYSSLRCTGFSLRWLLLLWSTGSRRAGFSSCGTRAQ